MVEHIKFLETQERKECKLAGRIKTAVQHVIKKKSAFWNMGKDFEDKLVDAYFAEYNAVTSKRMEEITGVERERVLKKEKTLEYLPSRLV